MSNVQIPNVTVNKISKSLYDYYVEEGEITAEDIANEVWIFTDDQYVSPAQITKLAGIEDGAEVNIIEDIKVNGTSISPTAKVINLVVPTKVSDLTNDSGFVTSENLPTCSTLGAISSTLKGAANGVAELDANGKVPEAQLPSYVDDVVEYDNYSALPTTGESGKIYVDKATNKTYRWSGSTYVEIASSIALGETSSTAYRGDRGATAYNHSQSAHAPANAQANVIESVKINGTALTPTNKEIDITVPICITRLWS